MPTIQEKVEELRNKELSQFGASKKGFIELGTVKSGEMFGKDFRMSYGKLSISEKRVYQHTLFIGQTGSGKTNEEKNLIYEALANTKASVIVVDGKGSKDLAKSLCVMASELGIGAPPVLKLGWNDGSKSAMFNPFVGDNQVIYNMLVAMLDLEPLESEGDYYRVARREVLQHICGLNMHRKYRIPPVEPPRAAEELEERLTQTWFTKTYGKDVSDARFKEWKPDTVNSLKTAINEAVTPFLHVLSSKGFKLGEHRLQIFSVAEPAVSFNARYFFQLIASCAHAKMSTESDNGTFWFMDEFHLLGTKRVLKLINQGRESRNGLFLITQSLAALSEDRNAADQIVEGVSTVIFMKSNPPDELLKKYGTKPMPDVTQRIEEGVQASTMVRLIDKFKISANTLRELELGETIVSADNKVAKITTPKSAFSGDMFKPEMEDLSTAEDEIVYKPFEEEPKEEPNKPTVVVKAPTPL